MFKLLRGHFEMFHFKQSSTDFILIGGTETGF